MIKTFYFTAGALSKLKNQHQEDPNSTILTANKPALLRSLFTVGALCRHFDFDQEDFKGNSKVRVVEDGARNLHFKFKISNSLALLTLHIYSTNTLQAQMRILKP